MYYFIIIHNNFINVINAENVHNVDKAKNEPCS